MRPSRFPVLWFFVLTYVLQGVGHCVHFFVIRRITAGMDLDTTAFHTWQLRSFYIINVGPSVAGVLMTLFLYGFPGVRRLAFQLSPWSVGGAWLLLAVCLLVALPPGLFVLLGFVGLLIALYWHGPRRWLLGQGWPMLAVCLLYPLGVIALSAIILAALGGSVPAPSWQWSEYLHQRTNRRRLSRPGTVRGNRLARVRLASPPATVFGPREQSHHRAGVGVLALAELPHSGRFALVAPTGNSPHSLGVLRRLYLGLQFNRRKPVRRCAATRSDIFCVGLFPPHPRPRILRAERSDSSADLRGHLHRAGVAIRGRELVLAQPRRSSPA